MNLLRHLQIYFREHKLTIFITSLSALLIILILFIMEQDLKYEKGYTSFNFTASDSLINSLKIQTEYIEPDLDLVTINLCIDENKTSPYVFMLSDNIHLVSHRGAKVTKYLEDDNTLFYQLDTRENKCSLMKFIGNVYGTNIYDKNLELIIDTENIKTEANLFIFHHDINVDNIFPTQDKKKNAYVKSYNINNTLKTKKTQFYLQGFDQKKLHENQSKTFDLGILIGILLSIITGVIVDFSFFYDKRTTYNRD